MDSSLISPPVVKVPKNTVKQSESENPGEPLAETAASPRVLIVAASPRYVGGQSVMAQRLKSDLGHEGIAVGFQPVDPPLPSLLQPLDRIKYIRTILRSFFYLISLLRKVPKFDVIHIFSASYNSFLISPGPAILISRLAGKQIVLNYHSGEAEDHLRRSGRATKWLLGLADRIVVPSDYLVAIFAKFGFDSLAIANHLDTMIFQYKERDKSYPRILVARTLDELYNIPCALKTFRLVQDKHAQAEMVVLGGGPQKRNLENLARELKLENVQFRGFVERSEMAQLYAQADVFLNTSSIDNMPVSILEAFASGLPVVSTNAGGIPYLVTDKKNGFLANVNDHVALAEKILKLLSCSSEVRRLSRAGHEEIKKYSWDAVGANWILLYQELYAKSA